jgi:hypothetical protein
MFSVKDDANERAWTTSKELYLESVNDITSATLAREATLLAQATSLAAIHLGAMVFQLREELEEIRQTKADKQ